MVSVLLPSALSTVNGYDARNACPIATAEMQRFHYVYLNSEYNQDVLKTWDTGGCRGDIERKLDILFDQDNADAVFAVHAGDDASDVSHNHRREPEGGLVEQQ